MHKVAKMSEKRMKATAGARKVDIRHVYASEEIDTAIEDYILRQRRQRRSLKKGEAVVELAVKGLKAEGVL